MGRFVQVRPLPIAGRQILDEIPVLFGTAKGVPFSGTRDRVGLTSSSYLPSAGYVPTTAAMSGARLREISNENDDFVFEGGDRLGQTLPFYGRDLPALLERYEEIEEFED